MNADSAKQWFAMRATYKREVMAQEYLNSKGIRTFIPMKTSVKVVRGIKRKVTQPAISGLVFVYAQKQELQMAKTGVDYLQYLTRRIDGRNVPILVPQNQMEQFILVVQDDNIDKTFYAPNEVDFSAGTKVRVHGGPFNGFEGVLLKIQGKSKRQFVIDFEGLCSLSTATVQPDLLEVIKQK